MTGNALRELKLPSLEYRRLRGDLLETYKILNGTYDPLTTNNLLTKSNTTKSVTRSHSLKLSKPRVNTTTYKIFFTNRIINPWNELPEDVVSAKSLNCFKNKLDKHYKNIIYSINF